MGEDKNSDGITGVGMFLAAYVDEGAAEQTLERMNQARKKGEIDFDNAVVIRNDYKGKVHIKETGDMSTGKGAGIGALIGGVIGLLGGPGGIVAGAAVGALAAHGDAGFDNKTLKEIGGALVPGSSALIATTSDKFVEEVRKQSEKGETQSHAKEIASDIGEHLQARRDVLYSLVITEAGVAASQVVSSPSELAVFGIAADGGGIVAGQAVATEDGVVYEAAAATENEATYEAGVVTEEGGAVVDAYAKADEDEAGDDESA